MMSIGPKFDSWLRCFFRNKFFIIFGRKEIKMLVSIIIIKLIIHLILRYYYSCTLW